MYIRLVSTITCLSARKQKSLVYNLVSMIICLAIYMTNMSSCVWGYMIKDTVSLKGSSLCIERDFEPWAWHFGCLCIKYSTVIPLNPLSVSLWIPQLKSVNMHLTSRVTFCMQMQLLARDNQLVLERETVGDRPPLSHPNLRWAFTVLLRTNRCRYLTK